MEQEDYVSFETAKLLKEKGFDKYPLFPCYKEDNGEFIDIPTTLDTINYCFITAPTIQMAMKWLRNIHDIVCSIGLFTDLPEMPPYWSFNILNQSTANVMYEAFDVKCETYEEACESAIKYCLENLI